MKLTLEYKKIKRTGIVPGCLAGGILAAAVPILELAVRSEQYTQLRQSPLRTIMQADWQMMSMLNMLLVITIACMMYHTEYADNAVGRMITLPLREEKIFFGKCFLLSGMCAVVLIIEMLSIIFCTLRWFGGEEGAYTAFYGASFASAYMKFVRDLAYNFGYCFCMLLPVVILSLLVASACKNMWVSLGIDVVCLFMATMIPVRYFALSVFPFALPFQILEEAKAGRALQYLTAAMIEIIIIGAAETVFLKVRRAAA